MQTAEESARIRAYDAHKCVKGRKRHLLVDTSGLPIAWYVTPADLSDPQGARRLLGGLAYFVPRLKMNWADATYRGKELADWCRHQGGGWDLEMVERQPSTHGFQVQSRRWVVERSFAWLCRNRRLAKDYERKVQTSETLIEVAAIRLVLRRVARGPQSGPRLSYDLSHQPLALMLLHAEQRDASVDAGLLTLSSAIGSSTRGAIRPGALGLRHRRAGTLSAAPHVSA